MPALEQSLTTIEIGKVRCLFGADFDHVRQLWNGAKPADRPRLVLMKRFDTVPAFETLVDAIADLLADTAARMWPLWYTNLDFSDLRPADLGGCAGLGERRLGDLPQVSPLWFERAAARMLAGRGLRAGEFPRETELQQLVLAISRCGLVLVLAVADKTPAQGALRGLAHAAEWLARRGRIAVAVLLSAALAGSAEIVTIGADSVDFTSAMPAPDPALMAEADQDDVWLGPIIGRPHPNSASEHKLAAALRLDAELRTLFSFNQTVETIYRSCPIIDLLWADGRVAIEIDGSSHWHASQYVADRQRDYELIVSGYLVLRLADQEIMIDTRRVVEKIRKVVEHRRTTNREIRRT